VCDGEGRLSGRRWKDGTLVDDMGEQKVQVLDPWRVMSGTPSRMESEESGETECLLETSKMV